MSQVDEDLSFFERERDKLSREVTSVNFYLSASIPCGPNNFFTAGFWRTSFIYKRVEPKAWRGLRNDQRIWYDCCSVAPVLSVNERAGARWYDNWGASTRVTWNRWTCCIGEAEQRDVKNVRNMSFSFRNTGIQVQSTTTKVRIGVKTQQDDFFHTSAQWATCNKTSQDISDTQINEWLTQENPLNSAWSRDDSWPCTGVKVGCSRVNSSSKLLVSALPFCRYF